MTQKAFMKSLSEVMEEYSPVYPDTHKWIDTIGMLLVDDAEILTELQRQHKMQGEFREPIVISKAEPNDPDDFSNVADGTHRVVAAYLMGLENVLVSHEFPDYEDKGYVNVTHISKYDDSAITEEEFDFLVDKLRSFPLSDDLWITSSLSCLNPEGLEIIWDTDDLELIPAIDAHVQDRLAELMPTTYLEVETYASYFEDDDDD